jgi:hypothetical protein
MYENVENQKDLKTTLYKTCYQLQGKICLQSNSYIGKSCRNRNNHLGFGLSDGALRIKMPDVESLRMAESVCLSSSFFVTLFVYNN